MASENANPGGDPVQVLAAASGAGMEQLRRILGHSRWTLRETATVSAVRMLLNAQPAVVVMCEAVLPDGNWRDLLNHTLRLPLPPPLIVMAREADDYLWMEVLNGGGYNLLAMPLDEREVFRLVSLAWLNLRDRAQRVYTSSTLRDSSAGA